MAADQDPAVTVCFAVSIDDKDLGTFNSCEGLGVEVVIGNQIDTQVGSLCAAAFGAAHPLTARRAAELSNYLDLTDDLLAEPLVIQDGELAVRQGPGLGLVIDDDKLQRYRQDR